MGAMSYGNIPQIITIDGKTYEFVTHELRAIPKYPELRYCNVADLYYAKVITPAGAFRWDLVRPCGGFRTPKMSSPIMGYDACFFLFVSTSIQIVILIVASIPKVT